MEGKEQDPLVKRTLEILGAKTPQPSPTPEVQAHNAQAREDLDNYFVEKIVPRLTALHKAGKLPILATCAIWQEMEALWEIAAVDSLLPCDLEAVKKAMAEAVKIYENSGEQVNLFGR